MATILKLHVENFKRIKVATIEPDETGAVILTGKNGHGKTSLMDSIMFGIGGPKAMRGASLEGLVHDDADQANIFLDLGDMTVERIIRNGTQAVKVQTKDGKLASPQSVLDALYSRYTFDPLEFTLLNARQQRDALMALVTLDVDIDQLDADRAAAFDERTALSRRIKDLGAVPEIDESLPSDEVSAAAVLERISVAQGVVASNLAGHQELVRLRDESRFQLENISAIRMQLEQLEKQAQVTLEKITEQEQVVAGHEVPEDLDVLKVELASVEATNAAIRANNTAREIGVAIEAVTAEHDGLTEKINGIDKERAGALERAEFPIDGLGFDADGVTFNGRPFSAACSAEQIRVSMGIAIAANPNLKIARIMNGSLLDSDSLKIVSDMARDSGSQVWIEMVDHGGGVGFILEDGELVDG